MKMTTEDFDAYVEECFRDIGSNQAKLLEEHDLGKYDDFWLDQTKETLQFKSDGKVGIEFEITLIGSWSGESNSWMWAWANENITDGLRTKSAKIKGLADYTGYDIFVNEAFEAGESIAHQLTAMAAHYLDAIGIYIAPSGNLKTFIALIKVK